MHQLTICPILVTPNFSANAEGMRLRIPCSRAAGWPGIALVCWLAALLIVSQPVAASISCYTCANDFIVWVSSWSCSVKSKGPMTTVEQNQDGKPSSINCHLFQNWRHYFLKRNYQLSSSDNTCALKVTFPDTFNKCTTSCFLFYVNGTDRQTGETKVLGVGRGCSGQFLTDEQYMSRSLGVQSKPSETAHYLPRTYDKVSSCWSSLEISP